MDRLSIRKKIAYAAGGTAMNLSNLVISQWLFVLYASGDGQALVPGVFFGVFFMLGRITDGVTDPLIAYWSDNARCRGGRRLPFIRWGVLPLGLIFFLLWTPPVAGTSWVNALYVFVLIQLYFVAYTVVNTPYIALLPEIARERVERINVTTLQAVFIMIGTVVFGLTGVLLEHFGWTAVGAVVAVVMLLSYAPTLLWIREQPQASRQVHRTGVLSWLRATLKNKAFVHLVGSTSLYWFGLNLMLMLVPFWVRDVLGLSTSAVTRLMGPFLGANLVFFFVFNALARRFGKVRLFVVTLLGSALTMPLLGLLAFVGPQSSVLLSMIAVGIAGIPVAGFLVLPFAMLADVADADEKISGQRREAIFFGVQAIFQKSAIGLSVLVFGLLVGSGGDVAALRWTSIIAGGACVLGYFLFRGYPLRDATEAASARGMMRAGHDSGQRLN